jgi:hypothetical protein
MEVFVKLFQILFLISLPFIFISCNEEDEEDKNADIDRFIMGEEISETKNITDASFAIGTRLCTQLNTKRLLFEKLSDKEENIDLKVEVKECTSPLFFSETTTSATLRTVFSSFLWESDDIEIISEVLTDESTILSSICSSLTTGTTASNTVTLASKKLQYRFFEEGGYLSVEIGHFSLDTTDDIYKLYLLDTAKILDENTTSNTNKLGLAYERGQYRNTSCSNPRISKGLRQTLL